MCMINVAKSKYYYYLTIQLTFNRTLLLLALNLELYILVRKPSIHSMGVTYIRYQLHRFVTFSKEYQFKYLVYDDLWSDHMDYYYIWRPYTMIYEFWQSNLNRTSLYGKCWSTPWEWHKKGTNSIDLCFLEYQSILLSFSAAICIYPQEIDTEWNLQMGNNMQSDEQNLLHWYWSPMFTWIHEYVILFTVYLKPLNLILAKFKFITILQFRKYCHITLFAHCNYAFPTGSV